MSELCTPPSARKRKKASSLADSHQGKSLLKRPNSARTPASTNIKRRRRAPPTNSTSKLGVIIELDSSSDSDCTPPPPNILLAHSKRVRKDGQPLRKCITAKDVIDLCSDDDTTVTNRRNNPALSNSSSPSLKQNATDMIKLREVIVLSSDDEVEIRGRRSPQPNLNIEPVHPIGCKDHETSHRMPARESAIELPELEVATENDCVDSNLDIIEPTMTQDFFNALYKDSLQKPPSDASIATTVFLPNLSYHKSPPHKIPCEMPTDQPRSLTPSSLATSEPRSFFARVISALNKTSRRPCRNPRSSSLCKDHEHPVGGVHVSGHEETKPADETLNPSDVTELEVLATAATQKSATIQVAHPAGSNAIMAQIREVTGPAASKETKNSDNSNAQGRVELGLASAPMFRIHELTDPSIFELERLPNLNWAILLGHNPSDGSKHL